MIGNKAFNLRPGIAAFLAIAALCLTVQPSAASRPVWRTIVGCVTGGVLISHDGYRIRVRDSGDRAPVDLHRYEGKNIRIAGHLLPGDLFFVSATPTIVGICSRHGRAH